LLFGFSSKRRERGGGKWKLRRDRVQRTEIAHQAIHNAARWTATKQIR
jgi:hypothetical protein